MKRLIDAAICFIFLCQLFVLSARGDWKEDYSVMDGFRLDVDSTGFHLPTAIAFVPDPGTEPNAPLYYVTEIRGRIRVVTNDRTVHTFAEDFFKLDPMSLFQRTPYIFGVRLFLRFKWIFFPAR